MKALRHTVDFDVQVDAAEALYGSQLKLSLKVWKNKIKPSKSCDFSGFLVARAGFEFAADRL